MNSPQPHPGLASAGPTRGRSWARRLVNVLVTLVVIAVAGATFVFSYDGVHAIALLGGVSAQLARYYPGLFDAVLVIACVAAVMLREGRWLARLWSWLVIVIVLAGIGATDVLHAVDYTLRHRVTEGIVAAAPVVAVLLAFSLLVTLLRQPRSRAAGPALDVPALPAGPSAPIVLPTAIVAPAAASAGPEDTFSEPASTAPAARPAGPAFAAPAAATPGTADAPAPRTAPAPAPSAEAYASMPRPQHIRYAGDAGSAAGDAPETARDPDYWDAEDTGEFAGLVYTARDDTEDTEDGAGANEDDNVTEAKGDQARSEAAEDADVEPGEAPSRKGPPELDDDAPPFATAPFASVPRLNRVRSTPAPPEDENDQDA